MDTSDYRTIAAAQTDYLILGPFPGGSTILQLTVVLSSGAAAAHTVSPVLVQSGDATAANHATGTALITRSATRLNNVNALVVYQPASTAVTLELKLDRGSQESAIWLLVAVTNGHPADTPLLAFANALAGSRPM